MKPLCSGKNWQNKPSDSSMFSEEDFMSPIILASPPIHKSTEIIKGGIWWYIYVMEYYSAIKRKGTGSSVVMGMNLESDIYSEVSQKERNTYCALTHI